MPSIVSINPNLDPKRRGILTVGDGWVDSQDQRGLQTPPKARDAILLQDVAGGLPRTLTVLGLLELLSSRDNGYWRCEELSQCTCYSS